MWLEPGEEQINGYPAQQARSLMRLPRSLSSLEAWSFGLTGHLVWIGTAPAMHAALGPQAIFVWLPSVIVGILLNLQVKRLGQQWPEMAGGTPNYAARLLSNYPGLGRYGAIAYFFGWAGFIPGNAIILTELIKANLETLGLTCPETLLRVGFTLLAYVVAFSGTRALGILHSFFVFPAVGFLLVFCFQGMSWLAFSPDSPGFFPTTWPSFNFVEWAKWYFFAIYGAYACETASSFVADSRKPYTTLGFLSFAAWLIPPVYLGASWVLMRLATAPGLGDNAFKNVLAAASPFWGESASIFVTLLIACSSLMSCATSVSNCPRVLYQLALDKQMSPVFAVVGRRGVLVPGLIFTLLPSLICLIWGDVTHIVFVTGTSYMVAMMSVHLGLWLRRDRSEVLWPWLSLGFLLVETIVLVVGGLAWSWQDVLIGLLFPLAFLAVDAAIRRISFAPFDPEWWIKRYQKRSSTPIKDFVGFQVVILIVLVCSSSAIAWIIRDKFEKISETASSNLFIVLLITIAFVAIAIACWTSLPQVASIAEAREQAENLFITALDTVPDTILVVDENGFIRQANPAAKALFGRDNNHLVEHYLNEFLPALGDKPENWLRRSEQTLNQSLVSTSDASLRIIEATISQRSKQNIQEYIVILRDITERKQAEAELKQALQLKDELATTATSQAHYLEQTLQELQKTQSQLIQTERMSSLGQLVAGVAHEINNPISFIHGNLSHVSNYSQELLALIDLYKQGYHNTDAKIQEHIEEIDLEFMIEDLPKTLSSMKLGTDRIREIVLTLRNFSRLDEADMKLVNIHEGIDSTLLILNSRLQATPKHPEIKIIKEYGNLPKVKCYAGQLNQVFINILSNALDALEEVRDRLPAITIQTQAMESNRVGISIKDNGLGMSETVLARLFDPFFTTKPVGKGTGLGLSISYQIVVDKHNGSLECKSEPGKGSEFMIEIPIQQSKKAN